jgi:hypothetical protein
MKGMELGEDCVAFVKVLNRQVPLLMFNDVV